MRGGEGSQLHLEKIYWPCVIANIPGTPWIWRKMGPDTDSLWWYKVPKESSAWRQISGCQWSSGFSVALPKFNHDAPADLWVDTIHSVIIYYILLEILDHIPDSKIQWPWAWKQHENYTKLITACHPWLHGAFVAIDGLKGCQQHRYRECYL